MSKPVSINGWPVILSSDSPDLDTGVIPGTKISLRGHKHALPLFLALSADFNEHVAALRPKECGMWNPRKARMANAWSDHASGTAVDLNWGHEGAMGPNGGMKTMTTKQIAACRTIARKYQVVWGGDYKNSHSWDPMHFAVTPGYKAMAVGLVAKSLGIQPDGTIKPSLNNIMTSSLVVTMTQKSLNKVRNANLAVDGILGPKTKAAIISAQRAYGLLPTGIPRVDLLVKLGALH